MTKLGWIVPCMCVFMISTAFYGYKKGYESTSNNLKNKEIQIKSENQASLVGKEIFLNILSKYDKLDRYYKKPYIFGAMTNNPLCCISVPESDWQSLTTADKESVKKYAASLIPIVKEHPFIYTDIKPDAPAAPQIKSNVMKMTMDSWAIMLGKVASNGTDITADKTVH